MKWPSERARDGVAKSGWALDNLRARAKDSIEKHGRIDTRAFEKLSKMLRYVDADYKGPGTFKAIRRKLGPVQRPASDAVGRLRFDPERKIPMTEELAGKARS
jgi:glucose-6-phosphate 1-dehydrogenase